MRKTKTTLLLAVCSLLLASCGEQRRAQGLVEDFLDENIVAADDYDFERFSPIGKTAMIDSTGINRMRSEVERLPFVKKGIKYDKIPLPDTLSYIRATFKVTDKGGKEQQCTQTFYMDKELKHIIAFKEN